MNREMMALLNSERSERARIFNRDAIYVSAFMLGVLAAMLVARWMGVQ